MTEQKKTSLLGFITAFVAVAVFIVGFIYIKQKYNQDKMEKVEIAWKGTAFEWSERAAKDTSFVPSLEDKYIEIEGILLNVVYSQGATTLYFTSGFQTDSTYLVGQQPEWKTIEAQSARSSCDTLILMYGRNYKLQPAPIFVKFYGDAVNSDGDELLNFAFFEDCRYMQNKRNEYRLHNFCANKITVRAQLKSVEKNDRYFTVELNEVLVLSNQKNKIKMQE